MMKQAIAEMANAANTGFVQSDSGPVAMGYWTGQDLPWAYSLAATFPLADRWFASVLGQTQPNRRYLLAATSVGMVDNVLPENLLPAPAGTIFDRLDARGIPWRNYYSSFPPTSYLFLGDAIRDHASVVPIARFFADASSGNLPGFAIINAKRDVGSCIRRGPRPQYAALNIIELEHDAYHSLRRSNIFPEIFQALGAAKERRKVCRVHQHDIAGPLVVRRQPEQAVEFRVSRGSEWMRASGIDGLARE